MNPMPDKRVVTFHPTGDGYGILACDWETEPRKQPVAEWTAQGFAEGLGAASVSRRHSVTLDIADVT